MKPDISEILIRVAIMIICLGAFSLVRQKPERWDPLITIIRMIALVVGLYAVAGLIILFLHYGMML